MQVRNLIECSKSKNSVRMPTIKKLTALKSSLNKKEKAQFQCDSNVHLLNFIEKNKVLSLFTSILLRLTNYLHPKIDFNKIGIPSYRGPG